MVQEHEAALVLKSEEFQNAKEEKVQLRRDLDRRNTTAEKQGDALQAHAQDVQRLRNELKVRNANLQLLLLEVSNCSLQACSAVFLMAAKSHHFPCTSTVCSDPSLRCCQSAWKTAEMYTCDVSVA